MDLTRLKGLGFFLGLCALLLTIESGYGMPGRRGSGGFPECRTPLNSPNHPYFSAPKRVGGTSTMGTQTRIEETTDLGLDEQCLALVCDLWKRCALGIYRKSKGALGDVLQSPLVTIPVLIGGRLLMTVMQPSNWEMMIWWPWYVCRSACRRACRGL